MFQKVFLICRLVLEKIFNKIFVKIMKFLNCRRRKSLFSIENVMHEDDFEFKIRAPHLLIHIVLTYHIS